MTCEFDNGIMNHLGLAAANQLPPGPHIATNYRGPPLSVVIVANKGKHVQLNSLTRFTQSQLVLNYPVIV